MKKINNVHYEFVNSYNDKLKEVAVNYTLNGVPHRYFIFLQKKGKEKDAYYLKEAKKKFNEDYKSGKVIRSTKLDHSKPVLITLTSFFGAAAVALGCFLGHMYATGGFNGGGGGGGGGGDEPEPIVWKDATQEEILTVRDNVVAAHVGKNPFVFLSQLNGTQYKITDSYIMDVGKMNGDDEKEVNIYEIDTSAFYIKKTYIHDENDPVITYITCREYEDPDSEFSGYGVYECYDDGQPTPTKSNTPIYKQPTFDRALKAFTGEHWDSTIRGYAKGIYGADNYEYDDDWQTGGVDQLAFAIDSYMTTLDFAKTQFPELVVPDMTYQKGNSTSLKFDHVVDYSAQMGKVDTKFKFDMENSLLKNKYEKIELIMEGETLASVIDEFKVETTSFTPDDLSSYFAS